MRKKIFNNIGIKLVAVIVAIIVWWAIVNVDNPLKRKTFSGITVEIQNAESLISKGYIYKIESGNTTSITISAPESVVNELKVSDFKAVADVSQLSPLTDSVPIEVVCIRDDLANQIVNITTKTTVVKLDIDNKDSVDFTLVADITGTPAADYYTSDCHISPATIKVTGASTLIESIDHVALSYDISDMTSSVSEKLAPIFYDAAGNVIDASGLEVSRNQFTLTLDIYPSKWINVTYAVSGTPHEGYTMTGYSQNLEQVKITGTKENLANISELVIPSNAIDVTGIASNSTYTLKLAKYLSGNYRIVSESKELIVKVNVEPNYEEKYTIKTDDITVKNLADTLTYEFVDDEIVVSVDAIRAVHDNFNLSELAPSIDVQNFDEGEYNVIVSLVDSTDYKVIGTYTASIEIFDKETAKEHEEEREKESE